MRALLRLVLPACVFVFEFKCLCVYEKEREPLQFYWFRSAVKLFNSMLNTNSDILRRVVQADFNLQPRSSACWTAQLLSAFQGLRGCELYVLAV